MKVILKYKKWWHRFSPKKRKQLRTSQLIINHIIEKPEFQRKVYERVARHGWVEMEHTHDWLIRYHNMSYRDIKGVEYVVDVYQCECGAGGEVKTPLEVWKKGNKKLGIEEFGDGRAK